MVQVRVGTTDDIRADVATIRSVLDEAFDGDFADDDWAHSVGGRHVVVTDGGVIVGHASLVERDLVVGGDRLTAGYVEAVAVLPDRQGRGLGTTAMRAIADLLVADSIPGFLSTGEWRFYERSGWERWQGPTSVVTSDGQTRRTPDEDDGIMVFDPERLLDRRRPIACFERPGDDW